jgi:hypothetical protein
LWIVATQDCDLASTAGDSEETIEVLPVYESGEEHSGYSIRDRLFYVTDRLYVDRRSPKVHVFSRVIAGHERRPDLDARARRYFKTWLGRNYDRAAIPTQCIPTARRVSKAGEKEKNRDVEILVRDILMVFEDEEQPERVALYAVVYNGVPERLREVELWLNGIAIKLGAKGTVVTRREALLESRTSLTLIEASYSADLSDLSMDSDDGEREF